jgi:hypothetical protein
VTSRFTVAETNMLQTAQGSTAQLQYWLTEVLNEWRGALIATDHRVALGATIPDQLKRHVMALAVWMWLRDFPKLDVFKTQERKDAAMDAEKIYERICNKTFGSIEDIYPQSQVANWNSQPLVHGRMMPVPLPDTQLATASQLYANPNAPDDTVPTNSGNLPLTPLGLTLTPGNGQITLQWDVSVLAVSYNVYRSLTSGTETLLTNVTTTYYTDAGLANGTAYFYQISAVSAVGVSPRTGEQTQTPQAQDT